MRVRFRAIDGGFDADEYALICGVRGRGSDGAEHSLILSRSSEPAAAEDPGDDWGVYMEFDDQINGGYDRVSQCRLSRTTLSVDLSGQLGRLIGVEGFDVGLSLGDELYEQLHAGLSRIFRDLPGMLIRK